MYLIFFISVICFFGEAINSCKDDNVPTEDDNKMVFVIVNDSLRPHDLVILTKLIAIANDPEIVSANECAKKIAIIGTAMPCEDHFALHNIHLSTFAYCKEPFISMRDRDAFSSLAGVKKIPIPAQCKKAKNITKKH